MDFELKHNESKLIYIIRVVKALKKEGLNFNDVKKVCFNQINMSAIPDFVPSLYKHEENLLKNVFAGVVNPVFLPADLYEFNYLNLESGVGMGFGLESDFPEGTPKFKTASSFKKNIESFSGAKTFQQTLDLSSAVFDPITGAKRSFKEFKDIALKIDENYNVNWLKTEQNAAFRIAQSGEAWHEIQEDKDIFPLLKYVTVGDERVRHSHAALDGIIKPVGHEFWDTRFPPNDWGCRCIVVQLTADEGKETNLKTHLKDYNKSVPKKQKVKNLKNNSDIFNNNPGESGVVFKKTGHPYTEDIPAEYKQAQAENFGFETPTDKEVKKHIKKLKK